MSNTLIAPRRLPFPIGTKMFFYQATPPLEWTIDVTDNDRFLRVRNTVGGATAGPINTTTASNPNLIHNHTLNGHTHGLQTHTHPFGAHTHSFGPFGTTDGMTASNVFRNIAYRVHDNTVGWVNQPAAHLGVDAGASTTEGHHNHYVPNTDISNFANTGTNELTNSTSGNSATMGNALGVHSHSINTNYRPAYADCIKATLTG